VSREVKEFDMKEYNSVILAAFLHDIGKFLHRGGDKYRGSHEEASAAFIANHADKLKNDSLYDIDLVKILAKYHHAIKKDSVKDDYFSGKSEERIENIWKLLTVVKRADSYSCSERDIEEPRKKDIGSKRAPLDSIFSIISLDTKSHDEENLYKYHVLKLQPSSSFPALMRALEENEIPDLVDDFDANIPSFSNFKSFDDVISLWLNLLEKYTWAIPSDTRYETSDVSLYDHLRSSAAIAACLYKRHVVAIHQLKKMVKTDEFVFVGGDFSGIQDYIFDITNRGSGGASKRLRARSFFISLFSEVSIHKILHALELPLVCNIFSAGGKFLLLAPNIEGVQDTLKEMKSEIEQEIHDTFFSQFSFLVSWKVIKGFRKAFEVYSFFKAADDMFHSLETEKTRKFQSVFHNKDSGEWDENAFRATRLYETYQATGDCKICAKGPAIFEDPDTGSKESCYICRRDKFLIGQKLPKAGYVAFGKGIFDPQNAGDKIVIFKPIVTDGYDKKEGYYVELLRKVNGGETYYLIYKIGEDEEDTNIKKGKPFLKKYYANHVPINANEAILSFEEIATLSRWQKENKIYGSDLLGILKVDIDNLGLIFSKGFENPRRIERGFNDIDRKTLSRFLTMSRMLDLFFSGWVKDIMSATSEKTVIAQLTGIESIPKEDFEKYLKSGHIDFENIYTVYSAGDDMVLVGPWETMIIFSIFLNMQFRKYTCNNEFVTLSAGLAFVKPKHPIASAIKQAEALLEESKKSGKNMITFFGTTVEWERLPVLIDFFLFLDKKFNESDSEINTSFLHRLLRYHQMALKYLNEKEIEGLKYISSLSYDIGRNIVKWDKYNRMIKGHEEFLFLQKLINERPNKDSIIYNLKVPLFWALYRNRRIPSHEVIGTL
jgi:CRISPR-associated protein Csm1